MLSDEIKEKLQDIADRLEVPIDALVADIDSVRSRIYEIQDHLEADTVKALAGAAHLDAYKLLIARSRQQMADWQSYSSQYAIWESAKIAAQKAKEDYDADLVALPPLTSALEEMKKRKTELEILLAKVNEDIKETEQKIADHPTSVAVSKEKVSAAIRHAVELKRNLKPVPGTDAEDAAVIDEADGIRLRAIETIHHLLSR